MVEPHSSNFRVITTNFLGVRIFRRFTVELIVGINLFLKNIFQAVILERNLEFQEKLLTECKLTLRADFFCPKKKTVDLRTFCEPLSGLASKNCCIEFP